jgi:hypothetical protein
VFTPSTPLEAGGKSLPGAADVVEGALEGAADRVEGLALKRVLDRGLGSGRLELLSVRGRARTRTSDRSADQAGFDRSSNAELAEPFGRRFARLVPV